MYYWVSSYSLFSLNCNIFELMCNTLIIGTVHICVAAVLPTQHIDNHFILISKATHTHVAGGDLVDAMAITQGAFNGLLLINNYIIIYRYAYTRQSYISYRALYYYSNECCSGYALVNGECKRKAV